MAECKAIGIRWKESSFLLLESFRMWAV